MFFIIYQLEDYWNIMKLSCRLLTINSSKIFLKNKSRSGKTLSASFFAKFLKKQILLYSITWPLTIFNCLVAFNSWDIGQYTVLQEKVAGIFGYFSDPSFSKNTTPSFLPRPPPLYIGFSWTTPPKSRIFQWTPKTLKFFILNTTLSFKSN